MDFSELEKRGEELYGRFFPAVQHGQESFRTARLPQHLIYMMPQRQKKIEKKSGRILGRWDKKDERRRDRMTYVLG